MKLEGLRNQIVEYGKKMLHSSLVSGTWGNISARDVDTGLVVITPTSMDYEKLSSEDIPVLDENGSLIEGKYPPSSETPMHTLIYRKRKDVFAIVHTHSKFATAFSVTLKEIPVVIVDLALFVGGSVEVAEFRRPGTIELGEEALRVLDNSSSNAVLLPNHGVLTIGSSLKKAFSAAISVEDAAEVYYRALALGKYTVVPEEDVKFLSKLIP
jgi:L-ribulose-5-phosphate 4-epimerase